MNDILLFLQNHALLTVLGLFAIAGLMLLELLKTKISAIKISAVEVVKLINHKEAAIIDLRPKEAFLKGHIINALSIPLAELADHTKKLDSTKKHPLILVCANDLEASKAAQHLKKHQFTVYILKGGMQKWYEANMPFIKGA